MLYFIDFETNQLNGNITELAYCYKNKIGEIKLYSCKPDKIDKMIRTLLKDEDKIIFWHYFMPSYLEKYHNDLFNFIKGRFSCFIDFYSIYKGNEKLYYKISDVTFELIQSPHRGTAINDCVDLLKCYEEIQNKLK